MPYVDMIQHVAVSLTNLKWHYTHQALLLKTTGCFADFVYFLSHSSILSDSTFFTPSDMYMKVLRLMYKDEKASKQPFF